MILVFFAHTSMAAETRGERKPLPSAEVIEKLPKDGGPTYNRLVFEKSPYLLQHAANPVDWYPWGPEAFATAKKENKPIFLSVGYATCHWCHVMEHESFENPEIAKLLNEKCINIKVDREEMPHVDQVYMTFTQALNNGNGGWPMNVMMTAERKPFFAGTYFPKDTFNQIISNVAKLWTEDPGKLIDSADGFTKELQNMASNTAGELPEASVLGAAFAYYEGTYDDGYGGFGSPPRYAPKFPTPHNYSMLLRYWKRTGNQKALDMVQKSLTAMRHGGMYDQVGFGTHRYATDREWIVPHFEKMLYDQALLAIANIEAFQATSNVFFKQTADEIFTYVLRDMHHAQGGFYCAEDADSEGEEGKFYVWSMEELVKVLGKQEAELYVRVYNFTEEGNWAEEAAPGVKTGTNIPHLKLPLSAIAKAEKLDETKLRERLETSRQKLFEVREKRIHPLKDDKVLTDWNGLMIAAMARGSVAFDNATYLKEATRAADFVLGTLRKEDGRLLKRYRAGEAGLPAHLEDYAYLLWGMIELYEAGFDPKYLQVAKELADMLLTHYWDDEGGAFFMTADDGEELIVRSKEIYDGAQPSGNSVAAVNLLKLARLTGETDYEEKAKATIKAFAGQLTERPAGQAVLLQALDFVHADTREIVVVGKRGAEDTKKMLAAIQRRFDPNKVVLFKPIGPEGDALSKIASYVENHSAKDGKATAYICRKFACQLPTTDLAEAMELIKTK
jgi:hypothetical protein